MQACNKIVTCGARVFIACTLWGESCWYLWEWFVVKQPPNRQIAANNLQSEPTITTITGKQSAVTKQYKNKCYERYNDQEKCSGCRDVFAYEYIFGNSLFQYMCNKIINRQKAPPVLVKALLNFHWLVSLPFISQKFLSCTPFDELKRRESED